MPHQVCGRRTDLVEERAASGRASRTARDSSTDGACRPAGRRSPLRPAASTGRSGADTRCRRRVRLLACRRTTPRPVRRSRRSSTRGRSRTARSRRRTPIATIAAGVAVCEDDGVCGACASAARQPTARTVALLRLLLIVDHDDEVFCAGLLQAVRAARTREHGRPRRHIEALAVDGHHAAPAEHVVDLIFLLFVVTDPRTRLERALAETRRRFGAFAKKE